MINERLRACIRRAPILVSLLSITAPIVSAQAVYNPTGLPAYPNLSKAAMDKVARTDTMGHWCNRFAAESSDGLEAVEAWYRKILPKASETNLTDDDRYKGYPQLSGIKLAMGIDYVTVYRAAAEAPTTIELFRCSAPG